MALTYVKRFRMDFDLGRTIPPAELPPEHYWVEWSPSLLVAHADVKYRSFRDEIDACVFPSLGNAEGCLRLMREISRQEGFLPDSTWLIGRRNADSNVGPYVGTIQGLRDYHGHGSVQNLGVIPESRRLGLGRLLLLKALAGFQELGLPGAYLEVTAQNVYAVELYERLGFRRARTLYKVVDTA